jgi:enoyl-CoA hydratase/carnithine racemase
MLLTGRSISASEALNHGLVDQLTEDESLIGDAVVLAGEIATNPIFAVAASKRCMVGGHRDGHARGFELERELGIAVGIGENATVAQEAFLEKTSPRFASDMNEWLRWERGENG